VHDRYPGHSAIDLNRCGVPLIEIVTEPDMRTARDAGDWLRELKLTLEYLDVSDANMEEGSLRVDANVSARPAGATTLGTRTEIKNLNSFSGVERALEVEFRRHVELLERGEPVVQQTMLWDAAREVVRPARSKEESHDYRYFPDPDLPPLRLSAAWIARERASLPELPAARRARFRADLGLSAHDADVLTASPQLAAWFEALARASGDPKTAANWVMGEVLARLNESGRALGELAVTPERLAALLEMVRQGRVSHSAAKRVFARMVDTGDEAARVAERDGLLQVGDDTLLAGWIDEVLAENPGEARRYLAGEKKLLGVLVGLVMKKSGGRADPRKVNQLIAARAAR
jgi:aspartyl-tRNA(Asn)/glutamyl-tRNA(Gln) amidotransferase subunit B